MEVLEAFICGDVEHQIKCIRSNDNTYFDPHDLSKILGISRVRASIETFDNEEKVKLSVHTRGGNQIRHFLTELGVYRLILKSRKPVAESFKKWVCRLVQNHKNELIDRLSTRVKEMENQIANIGSMNDQLKHTCFTLKETEELQRHTTLINAYSGKNRPVVYIGKIKDVDVDAKTMLIKVGSTKCVSKRSSELGKTFGSIRFFHIIESDRFREFEEFLQEHPTIKKSIFRDPIHNGHCSNREVFLMNHQEIDVLINIANRNRKKYQLSKPLDVEEDISSEDGDEIEVSKQQPIQHPKEETIITHVYACDIRRNIAARLMGPKIQKYSSDAKTLLTTYNSYAEMCRLSGDCYARSSVQRAIEKDSIYKDFRWARLDQKMPNNTFQDLPPTKDEDMKMKVKEKENRRIALLNEEMDQIMHAFPDQVSLLKFFGLNPSSNAIKNALSCNRKVNEYWVRHWDDCNEKLKDKFLENNTLPQSRNQYNSKPILQIDSQGNVVNRIQSLERFCNDLAIGRIKAIEILNNPDTMYMDFYWRIEKPDKIPFNSSNVEINEQEEEQEEQEEESQDISHKPAHVPKKRHASVIGLKCQRYSQDGKLLRTYDTFTDIFTDKSAGDPSVTALKKAFSERKPYRDFIWLKLPREYPDDTIQDINDPIIKLDSQITHVQKPHKIIEYKDGKDVCEWNSINSLCKHLKIGRVRLLAILDNESEYKGSVWKRA